MNTRKSVLSLATPPPQTPSSPTQTHQRSSIKTPKLTLHFNSQHKRDINQIKSELTHHINNHYQPSPFTYTIYEEQQTTSTMPSFTNAEHFQSLALTYFKKHNRTYQENQVIISYLYNLSPFNQIVSESAGKEGEEIIRNLSCVLKYEHVKKGNLVFNYGDNSDKFYLLLKGKVDMIVPNEEEVELSEVEYYLYLLKLREFKEMKILNRVIKKNYSSYSFEEKSFDLWVKRAFNTIKVLKYGVRLNMLYYIHNCGSGSKHNNNTPPHRKRSSTSTITQFYSENVKQHVKKRRKSSITMNTFNSFTSDNNNNSNNSDNDNNKENIYTIFDSPSKRNLVLRLETQIFRTMRVINPHIHIDMNNDDNDNDVDCSSDTTSTNLTIDKYITRTKPIKFISDSSSLRKVVKITTYFPANSLKTGDTFGEMITDITQNNTINHRVVSVITSDDCYFGTLNKSNYNKYLRDINERIRKAKLNYFFKLDIFKTCDRNLFVKSFCDFFTKTTITTPHILFKQHEQTDQSNRIIYFIRDGEFASLCNISINEINKLLLKLHYDEFITTDDEIETESIKQMKMNSIVIDKKRQELINTKKKVKLQFYKENDVVGLDDCLFEDKYLYECKCISTVATVYEIHINYFKMILDMDQRIKERVDVQENFKRNLMIKLLMKFKRTTIEVFNYYDNKQLQKQSKSKSNKKIRKNRVLLSIEDQFGFNKEDNDDEGKIKRDNKSKYFNNSNNSNKGKHQYRKSFTAKKTFISDSFKLLQQRKDNSQYHNQTRLSPCNVLSNTNIMENSVLKSKFEMNANHNNSNSNNTFTIIPNIKSNYNISSNSKYSTHLPLLSLSPPPSITKTDFKSSFNNITTITHNKHSRNADASPLFATSDDDNDNENTKEIKHYYTRCTVTNTNTHHNLLLKCKPPKYLSSKKTLHILKTLNGFFHPTITKPSTIFNINHKGMFLSPSKKY